MTPFSPIQTETPPPALADVDRAADLTRRLTRFLEGMPRDPLPMRKPPMSVEEYLGAVERHGLVETVAKLRAHAASL